MTDAQTEAWAIALCVRGYTTDDQYDGLVEHIAAALAAKDAELAVQREAKEHARRLCDRAEARLAEASKALEQAEQQLDYGQVDAAHQILIRAVHRTLTEG